jgi:hypothetical protein
MADMKAAALICFLYFLALPTVSAQFNSFASERDGETMKVTLGSPHWDLPGVAGAPYSAQRILENVKTLPDGARRTQLNHGEGVWRDSQGRTRFERVIYDNQMEGYAFVLVQVIDPVGGCVYVLDDVKKVAHRVAVSHPPARKIPTKPQIASRVNTGIAVQAEAPNRLRTSREMLDERTIEGVIAEGQRTTTSYPIGTAGNDQPMVIVDEQWYSRELQEQVLWTTVGHPNGDTAKRLTKIQLGEPAPSLFAPSSMGYTIVDETDSFTVTLKKQ